jgi:ribosomal protein L31E
MFCKGERLRWNASSVEVRAPSSSIETHRFIANGFDVEALKLANDFADRLWLKTMSVERAESTIIRNGCREPL